MLTHRCARYVGILTSLWLLLNPEGRQFSALITVHAQANPSRPRQSPPAPSSAPAASGAAAAGQLFRQHCLKCHGEDGRGTPARDRGLAPPDFTDGSWQARRSNAQLLASILDGKGKEMPSWRAKISEDQARGLLVYVRALAPTTRKAEQGGQKESSPDSFEERYRRLQEDLDELKKQFRKASEGSPDEERPKPSASSPPPSPSKPSESLARSAPADPPVSVTAAPPTDQELFRQHCVKCHGADGTGSETRRRQAELPNFTDPAWQARRSDAQLLASILDGKGKKMPPWRAKISAEQARGLVAHVRAYASVQDPKGQKGQEKPPQAELAEPEPPGGFLEKLISWLGQFHPATVHFPIALMAAAAVAELLRLATGNPTFEAIARYCLWFGALTAVLAGVLGWFLAGFRLSDATWTLMAHRWLGTSTVAGAALLLVWSEGSRRPERRCSRAWFRAGLLVVAALGLVTGFFGGVVVFGLDHYAWPG